ncbi:glycerol kinase [Meridianimarinicoccus roseus]|jgi:glycerol kinase|uniref:Glycerol kinase n=1 Tax=Meridianimarinicoccus roseus TaxID=2072018 RepID=A0A2V2L9H9_9RHOB|nr:FGGY-family carbohydrate kinase [Meridianimarinicoccus roseus]PWR02108.1 glycerol kinase [Meridianimarinicoccus roseus]
MRTGAVLAIDEGTTNCKAILVGHDGRVLASGSSPVPIRHPKAGWVEQDACEIWSATRSAVKDCLSNAADAEIVALGISNQRESILIWDRRTGAPLGPVITWQCRRTAPECAALRGAGHEPGVIARTGLPIDPLFPATKIGWLLREAAQSSPDICIGTVDSWLIWNLSGRALHETDRSNAARTQLFNLADGAWDDALCELFGVDRAMLPTVRDSAHVFGTTRDTGVMPDGIPIASAIGDSHAALFSHGAFTPGDGKVTFGTGSSVMTAVADYISPPKGITTTIAWSLGGVSTFAFEGNILTSASVFPWTAELLGLNSVEELLTLAESVEDSGGVSLVPAHVGLGAPHWVSEARGLVTGLSFASGRAHLARAATESMALQVADVFTVMAGAAGHIGRLSVDGGPSRNRFLMQMVADYIAHPIVPCRQAEASALGAAHLAGLAVGFWADLHALSALVQHDLAIPPRMPDARREEDLKRWRGAVARALQTG